jgi:hypothetical protein
MEAAHAEMEQPEGDRYTVATAREKVERVYREKPGGPLSRVPGGGGRARPGRRRRGAEAARRRARPGAADPWLWERRVPIGSLPLVIGEEGVGNRVLIAWMVARATRGELPRDLRDEPTKVLIVGDEDDFDEIWTPGLFAAGAGLERSTRSTTASTWTT